VFIRVHPWLKLFSTESFRLSSGAAGPAQQTKIEVRAVNQNGRKCNRRRWLWWEWLFNNCGDFFGSEKQSGNQSPARFVNGIVQLTNG